MAGRVTIRKAGEVVSTGALRAAGSQTPLATPRAVSKEEAPFIAPARESTKTTMMPWKGWVQRFIGDTFGEDRLKQFRQNVFFIEDDVYDLNTPNQSKKVPISKTDPSITAQYRYPSPGSQPAVRIPDMYDDEDPYDSGYFKRDTRRRYNFSELKNPETEKLKLEYMDQNDPTVQEAKEELMNAKPASSPGNQGRFATGPTKFDPTGLRATMSVTWEETEKSLDTFMPDHLPTPTWVGKEDEVAKWYEDRDLPVPFGAPYEGLKVPVERRVVVW
ncbi:expressed unknown protein [Seminavis robusta]|uniref:Uncharacterized protein n=1 Tax=Seminavis robusta TaxID=568900 RepID=A0A9N8HRH3_9STRA|nr:expressed unknown protein [Seminavis robusta]|eukprot:Sro1271_g258150.1 n/a (274) ;mRNA; r:27801-28839